MLFHGRLSSNCCERQNKGPFEQHRMTIAELISASNPASMSRPPDIVCNHLSDKPMSLME